VGLVADPMLVGADVEKMSDAELADAAEKTTLFARLSPAHKERVIRALRGKGHVVGFMGDGINDAPALRAADVGISVDTATDIAKESADLILLEKDLTVREYPQVHPHGGEFQLRQYVQCTGSERLPSFSADGAHPGADEQPAL
jgi:Mg2+-importing ATPase